MSAVSSFITRTFSFPGYVSPLFVAALDIPSKPPVPLGRLLSVPERHVFGGENWSKISSSAQAILSDGKSWQQLARTNPFAIRELGSAWQNYRLGTLKLLRRIADDPTHLAYTAASNSVYVASEGMDVGVEYDISSASLDWFYDTLTSLVVRQLDGSKEVARDDIFLWKRIVRLISVNPSPEFKKCFRPVLGYEIPFGLSPRTHSDTLERLISNAKSIALIPMISGIHTTSTAIANGEWLVAIQAVTTTGAVVVILLSTVAVADRVLAWMKR